MTIEGDGKVGGENWLEVLPLPKSQFQEVGLGAPSMKASKSTSNVPQPATALAENEVVPEAPGSTEKGREKDWVAVMGMPKTEVLTSAVMVMV